MLSLTDKLIPNPQGVAFSRSRARFQVAVAGRRSGKTLRAKRKLVRHALIYPGRYAACAPTRDQAKGLYWEDLKRLCSGVMLGEPLETALTIKLVNGSTISVVGLDKPQRIEGTPWHGLLIDEFDDVKADAWSANIRPALADTLGFAWFIGVPEGFRNLYEFWKLGQNGEPEWASFHWPSSDVVPAEELESARRRMDPRLYRQEFEASFEAPAGRVYDDFTREANASRPCPFHEGLPVLVGLDFNVDPMSLVVAQQHGRELWVVAELEQRNSHTQRVAQWLKDKYPTAEVWCDPSGNGRQHNIGLSDVAILRQFGFEPRFRTVGMESNKFNAVRAMVLNAVGERRLFIDPSCKRLIERMEQLGPEDKDDHLTDALGYLILGKFDPVRRAA